MNRYWKLLYKDIMAEAKKQWEPLALKETNKFFLKYPFKRLMLTN